VVFVTALFSKLQLLVVPPPKTDNLLTCHYRIAPHEGRVLRRKIMSTANTTAAEREAEAAVAEFLEMRAAILGRLSPEALRCVAAIFERRMEERNETKA